MAVLVVFSTLLCYHALSPHSISKCSPSLCDFSIGLRNVCFVKTMPLCLCLAAKMIHTHILMMSLLETHWGHTGCVGLSRYMCYRYVLCNCDLGVLVNWSSISCASSFALTGGKIPHTLTGSSPSIGLP